MPIGIIPSLSLFPVIDVLQKMATFTDISMAWKRRNIYWT
jgi:hypothetical protein